MIPRYTRPNMAAIWTDQRRYDIWLEIEVLAVEGWAKIGRVPKADAQVIRKRAAYDLARMSQVAMVAYMAGGSFLSLAYWDCFWTLIVVLAAVHKLVRQPAAQPVDAAAPARTGGWRMRAAAAPIATARGSALRP